MELSHLSPRPLHFIVIPLAISALMALFFHRATDATKNQDVLSGSFALHETTNVSLSTHPYWWLDSGAIFFIRNGIGETVRGQLPVGHPWQNAYARTNPRDTNDGKQPQNVFRILTKGTYENTNQEVYAQALADNPSRSINKNDSNGILLFSRYQDQDTLYYAGIRTDGMAVIKKKAQGIYYTLSLTPFSQSYPVLSPENLIPSNRWIGLRFYTQTLDEQKTLLVLEIDMDESGSWHEVVRVTDEGSIGGMPIQQSGRNGIRTDFMDVQFQKYRLRNL